VFGLWAAGGLALMTVVVVLVAAISRQLRR